MATLQKIRNKGGLLVAVLGIALLAFILGDLFTSGNTWINKFKDKTFEIDGDVVSTGEYQNRVNEMEGFYEFINGQNSLDENTVSQIREFMYQQMVKEKILDKVADKLGLAVTKEEMTDMVYGENISPVLLQSPIFVDPQTRQFNREALMQFLTFVQTDISTVPDEQKMQLYNFQQQWQVIENTMKYYRLEEKYNTLLSSAVTANDVEAKSNFDGSKHSADIAYVLNRYSSIPDSTVTVSKNEIEKLYNERKKNFKSDFPARKISYIVKNVEPSEADYQAVEDEMNNIYDQMLTTTNPALLVADYSEIPYQDVFFAKSALSPQEKAFVDSASIGDVMKPVREENIYRLYKLVDKTVAPDSVKLRMIVLPQGVTETYVDSLFNVIKGEKGFVAVANELNPQGNGGEVGWVTEPLLASAGEEFIKAVYGARKGEILKLTLRGFTQIVQVEDITAPVQKVKLAVVQMTTGVSDKTIYDVDTELNQFVAESGNSENFVTAAENKGYNVFDDVMLNPSSIGLPQISGSYPVVLWAFNNKPGSVKKFDLTNQRVIALVTQEIEAGYLPVSEVSPILEQEIIRDKKAEKMIADLKTKNVSTLEGYAQALNGRVDTTKFVKFSTPNISGVGREPLFNVYAQYGDLNKVEGPLKGNSGVYILNVLNRTEDRTEFNAQINKYTLNNAYMRRISVDIFNDLKQKLDLQDNRVKVFYREE